ncbi:MAG: DedA family protein [Myxococcales bacterium]|nr:DedA family protein [Myxococcales bacterium]
MKGLGALLLALAGRFGERSVAALAAFVGGAAFLEHVFPPVPGDLGVTVGAAVGFASLHAWSSWAWLYVSAVLGSALGAVVAYGFGRWLRRHSDQALHPWLVTLRGQALAATQLLEARGAWFLVVARFVPAVRAMVVVGAGFCAMPPARVVAASTLGGALWQAGLFVLAWCVGRNLRTLAAWLDRYNRGVMAVFGVAVALVLARWLWQRKRSAGGPSTLR